MKSPAFPRLASVAHALAIAKAHNRDRRFLKLREEEGLKQGKAREWTPCLCDFCTAIARWYQAQKAHERSRAEGTP